MIKIEFYSDIDAPDVMGDTNGSPTEFFSGAVFIKFDEFEMRIHREPCVEFMNEFHNFLFNASVLQYKATLNFFSEDVRISYLPESGGLLNVQSGLAEIYRLPYCSDSMASSYLDCMKSIVNWASKKYEYHQVVSAFQFSIFPDNANFFNSFFDSKS